jgi:4-hydroxythreonine-4-phosphate dehydrogenase
LEREFDSAVLAVDCDTRHLEPELAANRAAQLLLRYPPDREVIFFKKLDSTLRGNVAAELSAMLKVRRSSISTNDHIVAVMAPAFPAGGRVTIGGHQLVNGRPLHESETWKHQQSSNPTHIPSMLTMAGMQPALLGLDLVRSGEESLGQIMKARAATADVLVCDAETDKDLCSIAHASIALGRETIWAGSAGLAYHMPHAACLCGEAAPVGPFNLASGPTLIVIGSMSNVAREQAKVLGEASTANMLAVAPRVLIAGPQSSAWSEYALNLATMLRAGQDVIVTLEAGDRLDRNEGRLLSSALGGMMRPIADAVGALIASGGETARAILDAWGVTGLRMIKEIEPGLPFSYTEGWRRSLPMLTKAGAFGHQHTLLHGWQFLHDFDRIAEKIQFELKGA